MRAVVIYESLTGNTGRRPSSSVPAWWSRASSLTVCPTTDVDFQAVADADLVIVGSWTDGLSSSPEAGPVGRLSQLPLLTGKRCAVFCTFALDPGKTLDKLTALMTERGANVLGGMTIRRNNLEAGSREFVDSVLGVVAS